ncbi:uncharacterized protein BJ171DRAFT_538508 [Polychytrium aggregatum]|uniref:uncharacterized protein n=1 Tax=Polychytrium aggregatum TaxID=110093 RepID=UPI0022FEDCF3|nr:uncharacterized protein BJ171DRAFT_538508 [Polychytrium aggregatum]KAI9190867.1 hypothetical protein BJ171DRAFT_538508 [Polychytrium aggregatum]
MSASAPQPINPAFALGNGPVFAPVEEDQNTEDFGPSSYRPYNRGNKLKRRAREPATISTRPVLWASANIDQDFHLGRIGKRRAIMRKVFNASGAAGPGAAALAPDDDDDDPYKDIKIEEIWGLPESLDDVRNHRPMVHSLRSRHLKMLEATSLEMIEMEAQLYKLLNRISDVFQGDDPEFAPLVDVEKTIPVELLQRIRDLTQEHIGNTRESMRRLTLTKTKLNRIHDEKRTIARQLAPVPKPKPEDDDSIPDSLIGAVMQAQ